MANRPLISFCIPTYNRAEILRDTLQSYVDNPYFDDDVEIVISDNASTDNTREVGESFAAKYPNIRYFRNETNIRDANFPLSMDRASGHYLKLMNDTMTIPKDGLKYFKDAIKTNLAEQKPIFFSSGKLPNHKQADCVVCNSFDDFVLFVSRRVTGINLFGAWSKQWQDIKDRAKYSKLQLSQDDWCYQILEHKSCALIYTGHCYTRKKKIGKIGGYNWFEVQVENYYTILRPYVEKGLVSHKTLKKEKRTMLRGISPWIAKKYWLPMYKEWQFDFGGTSTILWRNFKDVPYFYAHMLTLPIWANWYVMKYYGKRILTKMGFHKAN